jgi:acetate kinase
LPPTIIEGDEQGLSWASEEQMTDRKHKYILTVNRGSSTLKCGLFHAGEGDVELRVSAEAEKSGDADQRLKIADAKGTELLDEKIAGGDANVALNAFLEWMKGNGFVEGLSAVGHRVVQGGPRHVSPEKITAEVLEDLGKWVALDPEHLPAAIEGMQFFVRKFPRLAQVACFDTKFHEGLPEVGRRYALPRELEERGVRRYGFHGLSYEFVMSELRATDADVADGRVIIAHLGSGASIVAVRGGKSVDTSMGLTPLEGLVMSTRSGDLDPGAVLFLVGDSDAKKLSNELNKKAGLLGVSRTSGDMRTLLTKMSDDDHCAAAVEMFCYRVKKYVGAYAAALGGVDALVFTGGIGEHAAVVREKICDGLDFLGIRLDREKNRKDEPVISADDARVRVRVVKTDEDLMIARHVATVLGDDYRDGRKK